MSLGRIVLAPPERRELKRRARKRSLAVELVKRTEVILMLARTSFSIAYGAATRCSASLATGEACACCKS